MDKQNSPWHPMALREIVGLFALPIKKPPDRELAPKQADSAGMVGDPNI